MIVKCSLCDKDMIIDQDGGEEYITEADETIHHVVCPQG